MAGIPISQCLILSSQIGILTLEVFLTPILMVLLGCPPIFQWERAGISEVRDLSTIRLTVIKIQ